MEKKYILVINPGSMTTKVSIFENDKELCTEELTHSAADTDRSISIYDQMPIRKAAVEDFIQRHDFQGRLSAIACRGAPLDPTPAGTYIVEQQIADEIMNGNIATPHVSMLAIAIGWELSQEYGIHAYFTDPISVDEFQPVARLTGRPEIPRNSLWHALNCRAALRRLAKDLGKAPESCSCVVVHLGSGITVASFLNGRCIDACDANSESPFSPERSGVLPLKQFVEFCYSGKYDSAGMLRLLMKQSGLKAHLGTASSLEVEARIAAGDEQAKLVYDAMIYQIAKSIGAYSVVLSGKMDGIVLTGAMARSEYITSEIEKMTSFIAPIFLYPGQDEMEALAYGAYAVLNGEIEAKKYIPLRR